MVNGWKLLSDISDGRDNNLNLIRVLAALSVLVSHAWPLTDPQSIEPLRSVTGYNLGMIAVFVFFAISGYLVTRSFERQPTVEAWVRARFMRIVPGLTLMLILTAFVLGPAVSSLPLAAYFADPATLSFVPRGLGLATWPAELPGVFEAVPLAGAVNGSLWTLWYEVLCYGVVLAMGLAGAFRSPVALAAIAAALAAALAVKAALPYDALPAHLHRFLLLIQPFAVGMAFYLMRAWLPLTPWVLAAVALAAVAARGTPLYQPLFVLALAYATFVAAYLPGGWLRRYNRLGDYSYGVYIYAWPVQQTVVQAFGPMGPVENIAISVPAVLALAWMSWTLVERPALGLLHRTGRPLAA